MQFSKGRTTNRWSRNTCMILTLGTGFRNDTCYDSGVKQFKECLGYETIELGNTDIYATLKKVYNVPLDLRRKRSDLNNLVLQFVSRILQCNNINDIECIWLCDRPRTVMQYYANGNQDVNYITMYKIDTNMPYVVVSDLGIEGTLICYKRGTTISKVQSVEYKKGVSND